MIARVGYGATDGIRNLESELLTVDLTTIQGIVTPNKSGTYYALPPASNPDGLVAQIRCYPQPFFAGALKAATATNADLLDVYLCLRDLRGGWILYDMPCFRLAGIPSGATMRAPRPLYIRPQAVDARQSYLYTTAPISKLVTLEFIYA